MSLLLLSFVACQTLKVEDGQTIGPLETIDDGFVSAFLMVGDEGAVLFDTGNDKKGKNVIAALETHSLGASDVTDIFITHGHVDHVRAINLFPNARVHGLEVEQDLIAEEAEEGKTLTEFVEDGDVIQAGGYNIEVFAVPGHTPGSAVFVVDGVLVLGDVLAGRKDGTVEGPAKFFSDDPEQNDASVRALAKTLDERGETIDWLAFSHSGPLKGLDPMLAF